MRSIFLCNNKNDLQRVFDNKSMDYLSKNANLDCSKIYSKNDILENRDEFKDVNFIFSTWGMPGFSEEDIKDIFPDLKCIFYAAGTVQSFAKPFLNCGVDVFSAWAANAVPVAEYTTAQIILANKGFFSSSWIFKNNGWTEARDNFKNFGGNFNQTVGIIGAGMIGSMVIKMLKAYNLNVLVFDPFLSDEKANELGVQKCSLEKLFSSCNVISNHLANNAQTKNMLDFSLFSSMLPYSTFINTGRGAQVVEKDLIKVLKNREDIFAILDVTDPEPPISDSEFYSLPNCILTPHIAGSSGKEVCRMAEYMISEFESYINGKETKYKVTLKMLETMA